MELALIICMGVIFLLSTLVFHESWKIQKKKTSKGQLPPGTLGWPFIGETLEYITCARSLFPESFMDKRMPKYGNVFKSHIFGNPTIVSIDPEVSKVILQSDASAFVPLYPKSLRELFGKYSILQINGGLHKRMHGLVGSFFKSPHLKSQVTADLQVYIVELMETWQDDQLVHIQEVAKQTTFQAQLRGLIGLEPGDDMQHLKQQFQEFVAGFISLPMKIPGFRLHRSLQAKKRILKIVENIIKERKKCRNTSSPRDAIDVLMNDSSNQLTDDHISDNVIDLMIPAEESTPTLITLAVKYLSGCPAALQQMEEENMQLKLNKAKSGEKICWADYMSLPFTQNVISETLRMANIVNGVYRKAVRDIEIKGHFIPQGWCVLAYFRSIHLDKGIYNEPHKFNPWRWQDKDIGGTCNFTPFGGGLRLCPGVELARLLTSVFLHQLITNFSWVAEEDTIVSFPTVTMKGRMPIRVKRKPSAL